ncbi:hypothetical protein ONE63_010294 [Megalurothrips usitatus]|uniref:Uncharacterized protein n=1 Tax=Megalurothrips usitatus TaxID=439358 RepID=A0AAV7XKV8_9NEOP|nr:hypothetical protein ONE63_010294 [Megalurothrips usitatus]
MFTTESTSTTTVSTSPRPTTTSTLSPAMLLYEERRQRARRGHGLGLGRYWRRRHALSHARRVAAGASRCADGETLDMLRFAPSGPDEALRSLMVGDAALPTGGALLQHARKAQFVFTGKVLGRGDRVGRDTAARENATAAGRRGRQTQELVPRGAAVWVRVKRVLKGDLEHSLVHLQTEPANGGRAPPGTAAPCPQLLRLHHTAIFLADKPRGSAWGRHRGGAAADAEANALPGDDDNAVELLLTADPFVLTLRNLQISSKASKGKRGHAPVPARGGAWSAERVGTVTIRPRTGFGMRHGFARVALRRPPLCRPAAAVRRGR